MVKVDASRIDLAREFREKPYGRHSDELQRILNLFRSAPLPGNFCIVCIKPHQEWALGRFGTTSREPVKFLGPVFKSLEEAEWAVFKMRWFEHTDQSLEASP
jgi:hypothetical protein